MHTYIKTAYALTTLPGMTSPYFLIALVLTFLSDCNAATYGCSNNGLTNALRDQFLNYHNNARQRVARGIEPNKVGLLNPAKNMYRLSWDCTMEQQVQDAISTCPSSLASWSNMGQNLINKQLQPVSLAESGAEELCVRLALARTPDHVRDILQEQVTTFEKRLRFTSSGTLNDPPGSINATLDNWWSKAKLYGVTDPQNKYTNSSLYTFANMVFAATTKIGCAYKICPGTSNAMTVSCLYNQIGYYTNAVMWVTEAACTSAANCTTYPSSGCSASLCTLSTTTAGSTAVTTASPGLKMNLSHFVQKNLPDFSNHYSNNCKYSCFPRSPEGSKELNNLGNTICSGNNGMPDNVRQTMLDLHNNYRSSVARGLEADALGGNAPKGSKMLKMKYDCSVEASAIKQANKCVFAHSEDSERPGLGENLFASSDPALAKVTAATQAAQSWWEELKLNGVGPSNNLTDALWDRPNKQIGHYTQMAWDTSYRLGCAVVNCPSFTYAVCQYGPSGNIINSLVYTIGNPCTGCPTTSTCTTTEGLCNVP
ncbi:unnamed protein product [Cylicocyclus nassatus]|uniref:SCP domain-containing protein n=1 Tax=Cylicocyclus nassatus TaxID=53992 RepID=A0AA36DRI9_CYLNA|nr:unnamed protein product [Cylicocyclus nassatus]